MKKKLKKFEKTVMAWTIEHPRQWRAVSTLVFAFSVFVQVRGIMREVGWMQVVSALLMVMLTGVYIALVFQWRRMDLLDEMRRLVIEHTDETSLGNVAWNWGYHTAPTKTVREIVRWLETHNVSRAHPDDMPQPVRVLVNVLTLAL